MPRLRHTHIGHVTCLLQLAAIVWGAGGAVVGAGETTNGSTARAVDLYEDPLPEGAVLRLGTVRFRQATPRFASGIGVSYSADGNVLATTEREGVVLWNTRTGARIRRLQSRDADGQVRASEFQQVAFALASNHLAATRDGAVVVWDLATGNDLLIPANPPLGAPLRRSSEYRGLAFASNENRLAFNWDGKTIVYDAASGQTLWNVGTKQHRTQAGLAWMPDGTRLVHGAADPYVARLWSIAGETGELVREFASNGKQQTTQCVAISHDGRTMAALCKDRQSAKGLVSLWEMSTGRLKASFECSDPISVHFLPGDETLVCATQSWVEVHRAETGKFDRMFKTDLAFLHAADVAPDGKTIAMGGWSTEIGQWDIETGQKKLDKFIGHSRPVRSATFSPAGDVIATMSTSDLRIWDALTGRQLKEFRGSYRGPIVFDPSGQGLVVAAYPQGVVHVWDVHTGKLRQIMGLGQATIRRFSLSQNGRYLVAVGSEFQVPQTSFEPVTDKVQLWHVQSGKRIRQFDFQAPSTESIVLLPDNRTVVLGTAHNKVFKKWHSLYAFDLETESQIAGLDAHTGTVNALDYANGIVASGSDDKTVRLWDAKTWKELAVLEGHEDEIKSVAFSPDGKRLASCDAGGGVRIWDVEAKSLIREFPKQDCGIDAVGFSPQGDRLVAAMENGTALVWGVPR